MKNKPTNKPKFPRWFLFRANDQVLAEIEFLSSREERSKADTLRRLVRREAAAQGFNPQVVSSETS